MLAIYGTGGFALQIYDILDSTKADAVFISDVDSEFMGREVLATVPDDADLLIAIADGETRRAIASRFTRFASLRATTARVSPHAEIGEGAILCDFVTIEATAKIGTHFHGNIYSYVAHECVIGDFVTFAPRVCCSGNVHIGDGAHIGTGAIIRQGKPGKPLLIGEGAVIGMGAVVTRDVPAGITVVGNPAKPTAMI